MKTLLIKFRSISVWHKLGCFKGHIWIINNWHIFEGLFNYPSPNRSSGEMIGHAECCEVVKKKWPLVFLLILNTNLVPKQ